MIEFVCVSRLPSGLTQSLIEKTGRVLQRTLKKRKPTILGVNFVTEREIQRLNRLYRGVNKPTDVLSFSMPDERAFGGEGGDIVIAPEYAKREAARRSISMREELVRLLVHATLHLYGYDHATEKEEMEMFVLQERCVERVLRR